MKCVLVIDNTLPVGVAANTAAILASSLTRKVEGIIGRDVVDASGTTHPGITMLPIPVLGATPEVLGVLRRTLFSKEYYQVIVCDFSKTAQACADYAEYERKLASMATEELEYLGLALYGAPGKIKQLTGGLGLLREGSEQRVHSPAAVSWGTAG